MSRCANSNNKDALALLHNTNMLSARVKHTDNRQHHCREKIEIGTVAFEYFFSSNCYADSLNKETLPHAA